MGLAQEYLLLGARSLSFGFLDDDLEIDEATTSELVGSLPEVPWGFHRGFDAALRTDSASRRAVARLPHLDAVASGGSTRGLPVGGDELMARTSPEPDVARLLLVCGGLSAEQVPWLVRAGVRQFGVGATVRPGRSWTRSYVDAGHVRSWRLLLDDALDRALGVPVDAVEDSADPDRPTRTPAVVGCGLTSPPTRRTTSCIESPRSSACPSGASTGTTTTSRPSGTTRSSRPAPRRCRAGSW